MSKHIRRSRKVSTKKNRRNKSFKKRYRVKDPITFESAVLNAVRNKDGSISNLASTTKIAEKNTRAIVQEFQFYQLNEQVRNNWDMRQKNVEYLFPTLAQFPEATRNLIATHSLMFDRSPTVKRNQLCRWFSTLPEILEPVDIQRKLDIGWKLASDWYGSLNAVILSGSNEKVRVFAEKECGMYQQTEFLGGTVQSMMWVYFCTVKQNIAHQLIHKYGYFNILLQDFAQIGKLWDKAQKEGNVQELMSLQNERDLLDSTISDLLRLPPHISGWIWKRIQKMTIDQFP